MLLTGGCHEHDSIQSFADAGNYARGFVHRAAAGGRPIG